MGNIAVDGELIENPLESLVVPLQRKAILFTDSDILESESTAGTESFIQPEKTGNLDRFLPGLIGSVTGEVAFGREMKGDIFQAIQSTAGSRKLVPGWNLLDQTRMIKDQHEITVLRSATELTEKAVKQAVGEIREGITMRELELTIEMHGRRLGATGVSFPTTSGFIHDSGKPT